MSSQKAEADRLYDSFRDNVLKLGAKSRHLFILKSRGIMTMKLLCTGLMAEGHECQALLKGLDALSVQYAQFDSVPPPEQGENKEANHQHKNTVFFTIYEKFRESFRGLVDCYRGLKVWYKTPLGLCTALYLAHRLKYNTVMCAQFELEATSLIETVTSFRDITQWHRWISGLPVCVQCQRSEDSLIIDAEEKKNKNNNKKNLQLCDVCENAFYCSLKCKKKNMQAHRAYCQRAPSDKVVELTITTV